MIKRISKKFTSIFLFTVMTISSLSGITPIQVNAASGVKQISYGSGIISNPSTPNGAWSGDYVYFGNMKWRVLDTTGNGGNSSMSNGILLQTDEVIKDDEETNKIMSYNDGTAISAWLNDGSSGFFKRFTQKEKSTVKSTTTTATKECPITSLSKTGLSSQKVFLLDGGDLNTSAYGYKYESGASNCGIDSETLWWLRSPYKTSGKGVHGCVLPGGVAFYSFNDEAGALVAAININKDDILFTSAVGFGKTGPLSAVPSGNKTDWKLTLKSADYSVTAGNGSTSDTYKGVTRREVGTDSYITVPYSATVTGACQLSIMITDKSNNLLYYGKAKSLSGNVTNDTIEFKLPSGYDKTNYKAYLVAEKVNGETETDYAGTPQEFPIPPMHIHDWDAATWDKNENAHWHNCKNTVTPCDITAITQKNGYAAHNWGEKIIDTPADCVTNEVFHYICESCGYRQNGTGEKAPNTHTWDTPVTIAPTCTEGGNTTHTCTKCHKTETTETTAALGHDYEYDTTEPDCTTAGCTITTCTRCDYYDEEILPAEGHDYDEENPDEIITPATCEDDGWGIFSCELCREEFEADIPALGHEYYLDEDDEPISPDVVRVTVKATCEEEGEEEYLCKNCGQWIPEPTEPLGHDFGEWQIVKAATGTAPGLKQRVCKNCNGVDEEEIPKHNYVGAVTKAASCGVEGVMTYTCSDCSDSYTEKIPALTHSYSNWKQTVAPTDEKEGKEERTCEHCGKRESRSIARLKHKHSYENSKWFYDNNQHWNQCKCGQYGEYEPHDLSISLVIKEPSEDADGAITYICADCGYKITRNIPSLGSAIESGTLLYDFTGADNNKPCVTLLGLNGNTTTRTLVIPSTITIKNITYTVNKIDDSAFKNNKSITKVVIPNTITEIGDKAFYGASNVTSIEIGTNVTKISPYAFSKMKALKSITIKSKKLKTNKKIYLNGSKKVTIYVPKSKKSAYKKVFKKAKKITIKGK